MDTTEKIKEYCRRQKHAYLIIAFFIGCLWAAGTHADWWFGVPLVIGFFWNLAALVDGKP